MKFKITSGGKPFDTRIINTDTGKPLGFVQKVTWTVSAEDQLPRCTIEIVGVEFEAEGDATVIQLGSVKKSVAPNGKVTSSFKPNAFEVVADGKETNLSFETDDVSFAKLLQKLESMEQPLKKAPLKKPVKKTAKKAAKKVTRKAKV